MTADEPTGAREPTERFRHLPARIKPEDMVAEQDTTVVMPIDGGRDGETAFMIRHLVV